MADPDLERHTKVAMLEKLVATLVPKISYISMNAPKADYVKVKNLVDLVRGGVKNKSGTFGWCPPQSGLPWLFKSR